MIKSLILLSLLAVIAFAQLPTASRGVCNAIGHVNYFYGVSNREGEPAINIILGSPWNLASTLCNDGSARGGGILKFNATALRAFFGEGLLFIPDNVKIISLKYEPIAWSFFGDLPIVFGSLTPTGLWSVNIERAIKAGEIAQEDYEELKDLFSFFTIILSIYGDLGLDLNQDGVADVRVNYNIRTSV